MVMRLCISSKTKCLERKTTIKSWFHFNLFSCQNLGGCYFHHIDSGAKNRINTPMVQSSPILASCCTSFFTSSRFFQYSNRLVNTCNFPAFFCRAGKCGKNTGHVFDLTNSIRGFSGGLTKGQQTMLEQYPSCWACILGRGFSHDENCLNNSNNGLQSLERPLNNQQNLFQIHQHLQIPYRLPQKWSYKMPYFWVVL